MGHVNMAWFINNRTQCIHPTVDDLKSNMDLTLPKKKWFRDPIDAHLIIIIMAGMAVV